MTCGNIHCQIHSREAEVYFRSSTPGSDTCPPSRRPDQADVAAALPGDESGAAASGSWRTPLPGPYCPYPRGLSLDAPRSPDPSLVSAGLPSAVGNRHIAGHTPEQLAPQAAAAPLAPHYAQDDRQLFGSNNQLCQKSLFMRDRTRQWKY